MTGREEALGTATAAAVPPAAAAPSGPVLLEAQQIAKSFGGVQAVHDCRFACPRARITGLIGPNGAGKSTAIDLMTGFKRADAGIVRFDGHEIQGLPPYRISRLGLIRTFQLPREWPELTVMENMLIAAPENGRDSFLRSLFYAGRLRTLQHEDRAKARAILQDFALFPLRDHLAGTLSGGQKRLLEFARIAMARPKMAILDEPMGGVNPVLAERMADAIKTLITSGITILIVEHNLRFIERVCDSVVVMALGTVIAAGPFSSLRGNRVVVDAYLGEVQAHA
jgi:ABC-type branched-subunit amino acid transport system ATPase component